MTHNLFIYYYVTAKAGNNPLISIRLQLLRSLIICTLWHMSGYVAYCTLHYIKAIIHNETTDAQHCGINFISIIIIIYGNTAL